MRVRPFEVQARRNVAVVKRQDDFDESCDPCAGLEMTDVRLDRSDDERSRSDRSLHSLVNGIDLDRVAERRAGSMGFHVSYVSAMSIRHLRAPRESRALLRGPLGAVRPLVRPS